MDGTEGHQLQNGAPSAAVGDVGQLINFEDDDGYRVEVRQQTEYTSYTAQHVQQEPGGTEEVSNSISEAPSMSKQQATLSKQCSTSSKQHSTFFATNGNNVERNFVLSTKSKQIEHVQFVSTLSKESFPLQLVAFDNVAWTLLLVWTGLKA